jgi:hypothetical protein
VSLRSRLNVPDLDMEFRRALVTEKGGDRAYVHWETPPACCPGYWPAAPPGWCSSPTGAHSPPGAERRPWATSARTPATAGCPTRAEYLFKQASKLHDSHGTGYTLHQLRHSGLTHLVAKGRSVAELQAKSRHLHLATLGIYVRLGEETSARITAESDEHERRHRALTASHVAGSRKTAEAAARNPQLEELTQVRS